MRVPFLSLAAAACAAALSLALAPAAQAQTLFSDSFDTEPGGLNYTGFANWNVTRGSVDVLNFYSGFGQSVDMDGSTGAAGFLETKNAIALTSGDYTLRFDLGKNGSSAESMTVRVGSVFSQLVTDSASYAAPLTQTFNFTVAAGTTGRISFDHAGGDNIGYVIDNVALIKNGVQADAPEPGSLALLLPLMGGLGTAAGVVRRRRK